MIIQMQLDPYGTNNMNNQRFRNKQLEEWTQEALEKEFES